MNLAIFPWRSLKARVTLITLSILLVGIWSLTLYVSITMREDMQRQLGEQQGATVALVAASINFGFENRVEALQRFALGTNPELLQNPVALQKVLDQQPALQVLFNVGIFVTRADGVAVAESPVIGRVGLNYLDRDHVAAALNEGKTTVGKPVIGKTVRTASFAISVPILDAQGKVIGAISGATDLSKPNFLEHLSQSSYGKRGGYLIIDPKSRQFVVATSNDKKRVMQPIPAPGVNPVLDRRLDGFDGSVVNVNSKGIEVLSSAARIPIAGWFVVATLPTQEAFEPIRNMMERTASASILLTLLAGALAWWLLRRQLSPLMHTIKKLSVLTESTVHPASLAITSQDEIGELIAAFNRLLDALGRREAALRHSERHARAIIEASPVPLAVHDGQGKITYLNKAFLTSVGYTLSDLTALDDGLQRACADPEYRAHVRELWVTHQQVAQSTGKPFVPLEINIRCKDESDRTFVCSEAVIEAVGAVNHLIVMHDITEQVRTAEKIKELVREQKAILDNELVGIVTVRDRCIVWANPALEKMFGYECGELVGTSTRQGYCSDEAFEALGRKSYDVILAGRTYRTEHEFQRKDGTRFFADVSGSLLSPGMGDSLWCFVDVTDRKRNEQEIAQLAFYDVLTALPNRRLMLDRISQAMAANKRNDRNGAVIFLDLDNFKSLNDTQGHGVGDLLLLAVSDRLKSCVREMDTVSRFGGDEFVVLLGELATSKAESTAQAQVIAEKIRATLAEPYVLVVDGPNKVISTVEHRCTASIGVVVFAGEELSQDEILKLADIAMYRAKDIGRNGIRFYEG